MGREAGEGAVLLVCQGGQDSTKCLPTNSTVQMNLTHRDTVYFVNEGAICVQQSWGGIISRKNNPSVIQYHEEIFRILWRDVAYL